MNAIRKSDVEPCPVVVLTHWANLAPWWAHPALVCKECKSAQVWMGEELGVTRVNLVYRLYRHRVNILAR